MKTQAALALPHASDAPIDDLNRRRRISGTVNLAIRVQECMTDTRCELPFKALLIQWHLDLEALTRQTASNVASQTEITQLIYPANDLTRQIRLQLRTQRSNLFLYDRHTGFLQTHDSRTCNNTPE